MLSSVLSQLQIQLHDTQNSLASHFDKVLALDGTFAEHKTIKRDVTVLQQLVEKTMRSEQIHEEEGEFGHADDDNTRSIRTVALPKLERVEEENEDQLFW